MIEISIFWESNTKLTNGGGGRGFIDRVDAEPTSTDESCQHFKYIRMQLGYVPHFSWMKEAFSIREVSYNEAMHCLQI